VTKIRVECEHRVMLRHHRDDHGRAFVNGRGIGGRKPVEFAKSVGTARPSNEGGELARSLSTTSRGFRIDDARSRKIILPICLRAHVSVSVLCRARNIRRTRYATHHADQHRRRLRLSRTSAPRHPTLNVATRRPSSADLKVTVDTVSAG
jgi:hypothetical protein